MLSEAMTFAPLVYRAVVSAAERHYDDPEPVKRVLADVFRFAEEDDHVARMKALAGRAS